MDRVNNYFNKPWNPTVMEDATPLPQMLHAHLRKVYRILLANTALSWHGAFMHQFHNIGGWKTTFIFVVSITLLSMIEPWRKKLKLNGETPRLMLLSVAAYSFGASIGPLINFIVVVDQRYIVKFFAGASVFFSSYAVSLRYGQQRDVNYGVAQMLVTIFVPAMMVIIAKFSAITVLVYLILWPLNIYMEAFSQESIYKASNGDNNLASHVIAFFTDFPALTAPRHKVSVMLRSIWESLRHG